MSNILSFSQSVQVINNYRDMTVFEMSAAFDIDEVKLRVFIQDHYLEPKPEPSKKSTKVARPVTYKNNGPDKTITERPPAVYSNRSQKDVWEYYENL